MWIQASAADDDDDDDVDLFGEETEEEKKASEERAAAAKAAGKKKVGQFLIITARVTYLFISNSTHGLKISFFLRNFKYLWLMLELICILCILSTLSDLYWFLLFLSWKVINCAGYQTLG